ncbi:spore germination protein [Paenibacillus sp. MZ04-78.2]|uniref:GerAB/ArcD/ProY family transporter n=1 Tax=Paenibacillus sp. MZ04-78.2 TaxID=2962034 RepID=UPI0020B764DA|nr:endospore germination permease [Paenibacillus sp. MZ04-78.2]MCP3772965.1 spore germination protein [Paenibacillus sp. MZ04-78.2]
MKKYAFNEITTWQYVFLIFASEIGIGVLPFPASVTRYAGTDSWISVILGWVLITAASLAIIQAMKRCPDGTLLDLLTNYWGKWAGGAGAIFVAFYFACFTYACFSRTVIYVKAWLLPQTPEFMLVALLMIPFWFIARSGVRVHGRFAEFVVLITCWMPLIFIDVLSDAEWLHLLPVLKEGWGRVLKGTPEMVFTFLGFEMTFILYPFLQKKDRAAIGVIAANTLALLVYLLLDFTCQVFYSPDEILQYNEPVISLLKVVEFPFIERFEIVFLALYLLLISLTWIPFTYCSVYATSWMLGKPDHRPHLIVFLLLLVVSYIFYQPTFRENDKMVGWMGKLGTGFAVVFPFVLWMLVAAAGRRRRTSVH